MSIKDTLYYQYLKQRNVSEVLENENGFLIYSITKRGAFIEDAFVKPEARKNHVMSGLVSQLESIAQELGIEWIFAHVQIKDPGRRETLVAAFINGFELVDSNEAFLTIAKKIGG